MTERLHSISRAQACRIALGAQRFGASPPGTVSVAQLRSLIRHLGAIQIDSVNVLVRSQYLPAFSRLGAYDRALFERAVYGLPRRIFEYWGHEASFLPIERFPLFRWRMNRARRGIGMWSNLARTGREDRALVSRVRAAIAGEGPMSASDFENERERGAAPRKGGWWSWNDTKRALEYLFWCGEITALERRSSFERVYDLTERVIPAGILETCVSDADAYAQLVEAAARAYGIATETDLRDYFRLPAAESARAVQRLKDERVLEPVRVEGWKQQAYLHTKARTPRAIHGSALLSPFDSLVWNRERTKRLFDFHYRIEIYTPAHKRVHGYYVLPYLLEGELAGRVDLKADRARSTLLVHAVHYEPAVDRRSVRLRLDADLQALARWLGLERVQAPGLRSLT